MPTNHPSLTTLAARVRILAIDLERAIDRLLAEPMNEAQASRHLSGALFLVDNAAQQIEDALYRSEKLDQSGRGRDLEIARTIAGVD